MGIVMVMISVLSLDQAGYDWVQRHRAPWLDPVMTALTESGNAGNVQGGVLLGAIVADMAGDTLAYRNMKTATLGMIAFAPVVVLLKGTFNRPRPTPPTSRWNASFPSGHAALAFYLTGFYSAAYPQWEIQLPLYAWAVGVAYSRVYLRRHWPTDVVGGALLGWTAGRLIFRYRDWIGDLKF